MCGRFTLTHREARSLAAELGVSVDDLLGYRPRYNIAPTDDHWIVRTRYEDRQVVPARRRTGARSGFIVPTAG